MTQLAEHAVIGCLLLAPELLSDVLDICQPNDFGDGRYQSAVEAMVALRDRGEDIDLVTVWTEINGGKPSALDQTYYMLDKAQSDSPVTARVQTHAKIVAESSQRRAIAALGRSMASEALDGDLTDLVAKATTELGKTAERRQKGTQPISEGLTEILRSIERGDPPEGVATGIDGVASRLYPELTLLGAYGGMGKSTLALNVMSRVGEESRCTYLTLEDSIPSVQNRILAMYSGLDVGSIRDRDVPNVAMRSLGDAATRAALNKMVIQHMPGALWSEVVSVAESEVVRHKTSLIVIDHLASIAKEGNEDLAHTSRIIPEAAALAQRLHVPVLMLQHLRKGNSSTLERPTEQDLKYGGSDLARCVWVLSRKKDDNGIAKSEGDDMWLDVAKRNHGGTGSVRLDYRLHRMRIRNHVSRKNIWERQNPYSGGY